MRVSVEVENDHLERLSAAKNPMLGIAELIWNAVDADANRIEVSIDRNGLARKGIIRIRDDGHGIAHREALDVFKRLGGSWKKHKQRSRTGGRILHGKDGQGRYKAFALGNHVRWNTQFRNNGAVLGFAITGRRPGLKDFDITDPKPVNENWTGTIVEVSDLTGDFPSLDNAQSVAAELAMRFALYLRQYPGVCITFDGVQVNQHAAEARFNEYPLNTVEFEDGTTHPVNLAVIEWRVACDRALYYCDAGGFAIEKRPPGVQEPGFAFTAYVKSDAVRNLDERGAFAFGDEHPDLKRLYEIAKVGMKQHFRARRGEEAKTLVDDWKAQKIYPYEGEPTTVIERAEREVFEVVAKNVHDYLPDFEAADNKSKRFSLRLLRQALESSPNTVQRIVREVLDLPADKAEDLAALLEQTSLVAVINASRLVADRLDFLHALNMLLYNPQSKEQLLERAQLQKILEKQTWLFGEAFSLSVADQCLNEVLQQHLAILGREPGEDRGDDVCLPNGGRGIIDLMLSRVIPQPREEEREHLVVELKRPSQKITKKVLSQIEDYALAVAKDARFRDTKTRWHFWAVSNDIDDATREKITQKDRPFGLYFVKDEPSIEVWAMPWSRIIEASRARFAFFQKNLEYNASDESALAFLRKVHGKYLPPVFKEDESSASEHEPCAEKPEEHQTRSSSPGKTARRRKKRSNDS